MSNNFSTIGNIAVHFDNAILGGVAAGFTMLGACAGNAEKSENKVYSTLGYIGNRTCTVLAVATISVALIIQVVKTGFLHLLSLGLSQCCDHPFGKYAIHTKNVAYELLAAIFTLANHSSNSYNIYLDCRGKKSDSNESENTFSTTFKNGIGAFAKKNAETMEKIIADNKNSHFGKYVLPERVPSIFKG
jgi:hypothetical protein